MAFNLYDFPTEIRRRIWQLTITYEPEVCIPWPLNVRSGYTNDRLLDRLPQLPATVDTAFPVAMHVCRESRSAILSPDSGIRFRASQAAGCPTPFRGYIPEYDIFYINHSSFSLLNLWNDYYPASAKTDEDERVKAAWTDLIKRARSIALEYSAFLRAEVETFDMLVEDNWSQRPPYSDARRHPKRISLAVPSSSHKDSDVWMVRPTLFKEPARRCKLVPLSKEALDHVRLRANINTSLHNTKTVSIAEACEDTCKNAWNCIADEQSYHELATNGQLDFVAFTFVEYQRDGTWKEVCQDRIFEPEPAFGRLKVAAPVPFEKRQDPEKVRVMDAEIELHPWVEYQDYSAI